MLTTFYWITLEFVSVVKMQPKTHQRLVSLPKREYFPFLDFSFVYEVKTCNTLQTRPILLFPALKQAVLAPP